MLKEIREKIAIKVIPADFRLCQIIQLAKVYASRLYRFKMTHPCPQLINLFGEIYQHRGQFLIKPPQDCVPNEPLAAIIPSKPIYTAQCFLI
jgi:hypothetical protein